MTTATIHTRPLVVAKFGGTSVATAQRWGQVTRRARAALVQGTTPVIVLSAVAGVTDALVAASAALQAGRDADAYLAAIVQTHVALARDLELDARWIESLVTGMFHSAARRVARGEQSADAIVALGETFSCALASALFVRLGIPAVRRASRHYLRTDDDGAAPDEQQVRLQGVLLPESPAAVIIEGFSVGTASGRVALLGRGGSDQTATLVANLLGAKDCEIWTDVPGFFSADPRRVPHAHRYEALTYEAAHLLASHGARVLQSEAIAPAQRGGVRIEIRSTCDPQAGATVVSADGLTPSAVRAVGWTAQGIAVLGAAPSRSLVHAHERVTPIEHGFWLAVEPEQAPERLQWLHDRMFAPTRAVMPEARNAARICVSAVALVLGCDAQAQPVSDQAVLDVLARSCAFSACHGEGGAAGGLALQPVLDAEASLAEVLLDAPACGSDLPLVAAGAPGDSWLWRKLDASQWEQGQVIADRAAPDSGACPGEDLPSLGMPPHSAGLAEADLRVVRRWIEEVEPQP